MKRYFKGIIKYDFLKRLINSRDYESHTIEDGTYVLQMTKNTFEIVPRSVNYYNVFLVR
jgi:hypothetical protein